MSSTRETFVRQLRELLALVRAADEHSSSVHGGSADRLEELASDIAAALQLLRDRLPAYVVRAAEKETT